MFRTMETKEYFDLDPIMYYINTCTALTDATTVLVCKGLPATFTCTCIYRYAFRPYDDECDKTVRTELAERN